MARCHFYQIWLTYILREYKMPLRHSKLKSPKLYWFQSLQSYSRSGNAFSARSKLAKSQTRFGLFGPSVETEDQWMTFRFGCIGNCAIRNAESFSDKRSSESEPGASGTENMRRLLRSPRGYMRRERECLALIDSSWRRRRLVIPCSFSSRLSSNFSLRNCRRPGDYLDANS